MTNLAAHHKGSKKKSIQGDSQKQGFDDPEKRWNELYSKQSQLVSSVWYSISWVSTTEKIMCRVHIRMRTCLLEILGAQSIQVLNNPKSSLWQALSLFEFPMAFRGLNQMAGKATASALETS